MATRDYDRSVIGNGIRGGNLSKNLHPWDLRFLINSRRAQRQPLKVGHSSGIRKKNREYRKKNHQPSDVSYPKSTQIELKSPRAQPPKVGDSSGIRYRDKDGCKCVDLDALMKFAIADNLLLGVGDPIVEVMRNLFPSLTESYLLRKDEASGELERVYADCLHGKKYVIMLSVTFSPQIEDTYLFHALQDVVLDLLAHGRHGFEVVLVPRLDPDFPNSDANHASARELFELELPTSFLAVPMEDFDRSFNLCRLMREFMVVDLEEAKVSLNSPIPFYHYGADFYPFTNERQQELHTNLTMPIRSGCVPLANLLRHKSSDVLDCVHHGAGSSCGKQQSLYNLTNKLVGVYVLSHGNSMGKVLEVYKQCKEKNFEFEIVLVCDKRAPPFLSSSAWEDYVESVLKNPDCCGWLHLPFDDRVCRRLRYLVPERCIAGDILTIIGPNNKYMDPHGLQVIREYGIDGYPFTKQTVCDNLEAWLRSLDLHSLFTSVGIHHLINSYGQREPITSVKDADVLLYLGRCSSLSDKTSWENDLYKWFDEIKMTYSRKARFEMIYACITKGVHQSDECLGKEGPWLSVPCKESARALHNLLYGGLKGFTGGRCLVAFGSDGRLRSVLVHHTLMMKKCGPASFPESDEKLQEEVASMLRGQPRDHWFEFNVASHESHVASPAR